MPSGLDLNTDAWLREHERAVEMAQEIAASLQERNLKYPSGGSQASHMTSQARRKLGSLGTSIQNLRDMLTDPKVARDITENERNRRRDLIRTLESKRENLVQGMARDNSDRAGLFGAGQSKGPPKETEQTAGLDNQELLQLQDKIMQDQDEELVHMEKGVNATKHVAVAINEELTTQEPLIRGLEDVADTVHNRLSVANKHIAIVMNTASEWKWWCFIFLLVAGLIIVLAFAFDAVA